MAANGSRCELDGFAPLSALATEAPGAYATGLAKCSRRISIGIDLVNKGEPGCVSAGRLHHTVTITEIAIRTQNPVAEAARLPWAGTHAFGSRCQLRAEHGSNPCVRTTLIPPRQSFRAF